jgi:hypothetical protein
VEWGGACSGSGACAPELSANKTVTARFDPAQVELRVDRTGDGDGTVSSSDMKIECGETCSTTYDRGATVTLNARQGRGSSFNGWGRPCSGGQESCELTLDEGTTVITADFEGLG